MAGFVLSSSPPRHYEFQQKQAETKKILPHFQFLSFHTVCLTTKHHADGPAYFDLHPRKGLTICIFFSLIRPSKAGKESFIKQILLSDLRLNIYKWKQKKYE